MFNVVLIVGVMVVIMNLLVSREFQGYIRANDLERFQNVKEGLQQYYSFMEVGRCLPRPGEDGRILNRIMMLNDPPTTHCTANQETLSAAAFSQSG